MPTEIDPERLAHWQQVQAEYERSEQIPLPAIKDLVRSPRGPISLSLIGPEGPPPRATVNVNTAAMSPGEQDRILALLDDIQRWTELWYPAIRIVHHVELEYGMFDYEPDPPVRLSRLGVEEQALVWGALEEIAAIGARHPDV